MDIAVLGCQSRFSRLSRSLLVGGCLALCSAGAAWADCQEDLTKLMGKRMGDIEALNKISKANGGKLDPIAACPRLKSLAADEGLVVSYMTKNKDWCNLPDEVISKMTATRGRTASMSVKACDLSAKVKQMQTQQAQQQEQQAVKLPSGPL